MDKTHLQFQSWNVIGNTVLSNTTDFGEPFCTDKNQYAYLQQLLTMIRMLYIEMNYFKPITERKKILGF